MRGDAIFSMQVDPETATRIDAFARECQISRNAALQLLVNYGLAASKGAVYQAALRLRRREIQR